ncbi:hypothetical protein C8J56DRAFT_883763 [Mycena floridula]|nr:hypothetical protein C8J56DRAFT_883763 [Mycena floridula]
MFTFAEQGPEPPKDTACQKHCSKTCTLELPEKFGCEADAQYRVQLYGTAVPTTALGNYCKKPPGKVVGCPIELTFTSFPFDCFIFDSCNTDFVSSDSGIVDSLLQAVKTCIDTHNEQNPEVTILHAFETLRNYHGAHFDVLLDAKWQELRFVKSWGMQHSDALGFFANDSRQYHYYVDSIRRSEAASSTLVNDDGGLQIQKALAAFPVHNFKARRTVLILHVGYTLQALLPTHLISADPLAELPKLLEISSDAVDIAYIPAPNSKLDLTRGHGDHAAVPYYHL